MNIIKFLDEFTSDKLMEKNFSRQDMFGTMANMGKKAALAAIPFGLATMGNKTYAQTGGRTTTEVLQLALTLEYLESAFYNQSLITGGIVEQYGDSRALTVYRQIAKHENSHVAFFQGALGDNSIPSPEFDFTVGGLFDPFNTNPDVSGEVSYAQFLAISQALEDTGVRAFKGQATNLMSTPDILQIALQVHSVEARHASEVRRIRGLKGWITRDERGAGMPEATQSTYDGEQNTSQLGVDVVPFAPQGSNAVDAATEAYDEPLTGDMAVMIASTFIVA